MSKYETDVTSTHTYILTYSNTLLTNLNRIYEPLNIII